MTNAHAFVAFIFAFFSIIPLAMLWELATEELALRVGRVLGGLITVTLGNAVELIFAIIALEQCKLSIVQSSMVGSILGNILLVLGMRFLLGGIHYSEQEFLVVPAQMNSYLLVLSVIAVLLPAAFNMVITSDTKVDSNINDPVIPQKEGQDILQMSHGVTVILLIIYAGNLVFQLWSHANLLNEATAKPTEYPKNINLKYQYQKMMGKRPQKTGQRFSMESRSVERDPETTTLSEERNERHSGARQPNQEEPAKTPGEVERGEILSEEEVEQPEYPKMNFPSCIMLLIVVTGLIGVTAEFLVDYIDNLTASGNVTQEWIGLIIIPILSSSGELLTSVTNGRKKDIDFTLGVVVGTGVQMALFVIPFMVVLGWIRGKPLTMLFDPLESVVLFLAVFPVHYVVTNGRSNWLEGMILIHIYAIIGVVFWFYVSRALSPLGMSTNMQHPAWRGHFPGSGLDMLVNAVDNFSAVFLMWDPAKWSVPLSSDHYLPEANYVSVST
ncbi:hypothetical protein DACRYDRAFT_75510 [Dacryopinax primogenitus]|uniref:Sodium/calcium exchanger membrane region domain-containing protein n=1 Tax=Dacryopinax primogenitus (strain DJM 731) TaxID=1858805 RepID=M5GG06_DACPD|nr:uncharacterized protein DACRYDRAFT_75510 [Dacryopinax primogenitus]EJU04653.1 hypothetical protein DACRYDRAFT_75510 [Dacryopinax primogenitus]